MTSAATVKRERGLQLAVRLSRIFPLVPTNVIGQLVLDLQRMNARILTHCTRMCNESDYVDKWSDPKTGNDRRLQTMSSKVDKLLTAVFLGNPHGFTISVGGDPRGACVLSLGFSEELLKLNPDIEGDNLARDGFDIY